MPDPKPLLTGLVFPESPRWQLFAGAGGAFDDELERRLGAPLPERTMRQFATTLNRLRAAGRRLDALDQPA